MSTNEHEHKWGYTHGSFLEDHFSIRDPYRGTTVQLTCQHEGCTAVAVHLRLEDGTNELWEGLQHRTPEFNDRFRKAMEAAKARKDSR